MDVPITGIDHECRGHNHVREGRDHARQGHDYVRRGRHYVREGRGHVLHGCAKAATMWENRRPRRNVRLMYGLCTGFSGVCIWAEGDLYRPPELASNCVRPAAALRDFDENI